MKRAAERHFTTIAEFQQDVRAAGAPCVMRGLAADWPLVMAAVDGAGACLSRLKSMAAEKPISFASAAPDTAGRLHYDDAVAGPNFRRRTIGLPQFLDLCADIEANEYHAAQGLTADDFFPAFRRDHPMPLAPDIAAPRFWIGGPVTVAAHADPAVNIAVVAAGRRRFTLFPPEAIGNLYMGPFHITPGGPPVSMAHISAPDFSAYPRLAAAMDAALVAELDPGDAIFIPYYWFHHVESLDAFNVLVNYWWDDAREDVGSAFDVLMHGMMTLRNLPADQRRAWRAMFDQYVFLTNGDPGAHLPVSARGIMAASSPQDIKRMRAALIARLRDGAAAGS
ncbi:MAG TPA: cupin-like domain-containing protein [Parvularcula sp.]|nr:cupin-like domain-containing protein [Parvularcula sp.]